MARFLLVSSLLGCAVCASSAWAEDAVTLPALSEAGLKAVTEAQPRMPQLTVHNRVLCTVLGKPISVLDVQKALEIQFYVGFPQYRNEPKAKYEFMMTRWKDALAELINRELTIADAKDRDLKVTDGDIREEMIRRFGADLAPALDTLSMTVDEAWEMVRTEIQAQRMIGAMVLYPAVSSVTADEIRSTYLTLKDQALQQEEMAYRILTVRGGDVSKTSAIAERAHRLLEEEKRSPEEVVEALSKDDPECQGVTCQLSEEFRRPKRGISEQHREILQGLQVGAFSAPIVQHSKATKQDVHRIFILTARNDANVPPLDQVAQRIHENLGEQRAQVLHKKYIEQLRDRYGMTEEYLSAQIPENFMPFEVRQWP